MVFGERVRQYIRRKTGYGKITDNNTLEVALVKHKSNELVVSATTSKGSQYLFFKSNKNLWTKRFKTLDFALVAMSQYASANKLDLEIRGTVSRSQLSNIDEFLQIWSSWRPDLFHRISIKAKKIVEIPNDPKRKSVLLFSGGVDSSFSLAAHSAGILGHLSKKIGLGVLVVGWDLKHGDISARNIALEKAERVLKDFSADCAIVATNWQQDFCPIWFKGYNVACSSILQTLSERFSSGIFSNDFSYSQELRIGAHGSHIAINHLLGSNRFPIVTTGGTHTRLERIQFLKNFPVLIENLRVCYEENAGGNNCGVCEKCVRTQLELAANGINTKNLFTTPVDEDKIRRIDVHTGLRMIFLEELKEKLPSEHKFSAVLNEVYERETEKLKQKAAANS
ncbi:MAG: hypothetical protein PHE27_06355 [Alphaproteobacteria bacterium]|nr:hypothetical protein [Alphaproteobacteria bacterium]